MKGAVKGELDDVLCKLISLESGGPVVDSILSTQSNYDSGESDDGEDSDPVKHTSMNRSSLRTPVLSTPTQVNFHLLFHGRYIQTVVYLRKRL